QKCNDFLGVDAHLPADRGMAVARRFDVGVVHDSHLVSEQVALLEAAARKGPVLCGERCGQVNAEECEDVLLRTCKVLERNARRLRWVGRLRGEDTASFTPETVKRRDAVLKGVGNKLAGEIAIDRGSEVDLLLRDGEVLFQDLQRVVLLAVRAE